MVTIHLGALRLRVASTQAKVQTPNETLPQITIFINVESYLTEIKIQGHGSTGIHIALGYRVPLK